MVVQPVAGLMAGLCIALGAALGATPAEAEKVEKPPVVQVLFPGFSVRELPLELSNINNVKYRADGTLVALAYDGTIWLLRDTDGDGLEDQAQKFWENKEEMRAPIGMDVTPAGYAHGEGVCIVGKTRCLLILDTDGDDRADKEIEVAGGWKESFQPVDGLGVAFDPSDGSIYYGRGTFNFTDPLLRDKEGKSAYKITDEAGTVIRVSPDFKSREVIATGIRFPVAIRFNARGDLFSTDQEGATWVPNGNPFDELLHIQRGRHYGFPSRHPVYLPDVIDEPSTFDYTPQHQSTCGLNFNEPVAPDGPRFGPAQWAGEAIVAGYSRGKLYRTQLAKSASGYVARTQILACLGMLTVDACVSPSGDLVVACHSGGPDWGTGPKGMGKLFQIRYTDREHPQPLFAAPSGPREVRVEFDRPVDPQMLRDVLTQSKLTAGEFVRGGDRFESLWPGYAIVKAQKEAPVREVALRSAQLTPDRRTLIFATDSLQRAVHYALQLPGMGRPQEPAAGEVAQEAAIDFDFDLSGCEAEWRPEGDEPEWTGWLPHFDLVVARQLTAGSAAHEAFWAAIEGPGELALRGQMDLRDMLRPAVQPGSEIDFAYPPEEVTVTFELESAEAELELIVPDSAQVVVSGATASFTLPADAQKRVPVELRVRLNGGAPELHVSWTTNEDDRPRPLPLRRLLVPWAEVSERESETAAPQRIAELEGGSWARGYREFFGEQAGCSKCHTVHGRGGAIGPDLSNLVHRDYVSVLRDITHPSFALNPDYLTDTLLLADGRVLSGVVRTVGSVITLGDSKGETHRLERAEVEEIHPDATSTMPEGIPALLGPARMRDLLTFLLSAAPQMPRDYPGPRPKPRTVAEVNAVLEGAQEPAQDARPIHIMLVAGPKDHGPGEHDYPAWQKAWSELLAAADKVEVSTAWEWPSPEEFQAADVIVFYQRGNWDARRAAEIDPYLERGGGLVYIHWAVDGREHAEDFAKRIGLAGGVSGVAFRHGELTLMFNRETNHPIIRNFDRLTMTDESYWKMRGSLPAERVLATSVEENEPRPQLWSLEKGKGRVFVSIPGHYSWTFDDPMFRVLLLRGIAWAAGEPVDRLNELVWPGADVAR